jgi:hypothetical protein
MKSVRERWFVRLPDGQVLKAPSTAAVIHHIKSGKIPRDSKVRRSNADEWSLLEWTSEFTEAIIGRSPHANGSRSTALTGIAARLDPLRLKTVGVRGLGEDLIAALDSTFVRSKLWVAAIASLIVGLTIAGIPFVLGTVVPATWFNDLLGTSAEWAGRILTGSIVLILLAAANCLMARLTHVELTQMRPARWREAFRGYLPSMLRLVVVYQFLAGGSLLLMDISRILPWIVLQNSVGGSAQTAEGLATAAAISGIVLEIALWAVIGLAGLVVPVLVVEDCSIITALGDWLRLIRRHTGRVLIYEGLAIAFGILISLPFAVPVALAIGNYPLPDNPAMAMARHGIYGLTLAPALAFLSVANMFIYLNVRYEQA